VDLHPGEEIVFEGHPSWRALLSFYVTAVGGAVVVGVIVALAASVVVGVVVGAALVLLVLLFGFIKRMATVYRSARSASPSAGASSPRACSRRGSTACRT
jgi:hypothetical protein